MINLASTSSKLQLQTSAAGLGGNGGTGGSGYCIVYCW